MTRLSSSHLLMLLTATLIWTGCRPGGGLDGPLPRPDCRSRGAEGIRWALLGGGDQEELDRWCEGVGPPVFVSEAGGGPGTWHTLLVVSWNMNGEAGELGRFLDELTKGALGAGDALVIFLQEAPRRKGRIPSSPPPGSRWGKGLDRAAAGDSTHDVVVQARKYGLNLLYVPSMRNGEEREDRGNAILSNLPLTDPLALELPLMRERRVAVSAQVPAGGGGALRLTGIHLDHLAELGDFSRSFGSGRTEQMSALLEAIPDGGPGILAGDFNVWYGEEDEEAVRLARLSFPTVNQIPEEATVRALGGLFSRRSDYLMARLPGGWEATYRVLADPFASDHRPLIGTVLSSGWREGPVPSRKPSS